jgi:hypothetical protein
MSVFSMAASNPALPTYPLQRSVRLRSSASAYFRRANVTSTSTTTWTYSFWLKRGSTIGTQNNISGAGPSSGTSYSAFLFDSSNAFQVNDDSGGASNFLLVTTQVFRDPSAWYHFVIAVDTTQATASNRVKVYVNGVQVTAFSTAIYPSLNYATYFNNATYTKAIGNIWYNGGPGGFYFDGYLEEINFIDGQALTPSSFGAYNSYGVWSPAKYTGTYGANGFCLNFQDNSAVTTTANIGIGADSSGNGNYWTSNNISLTAGVNYDSMLDVPTNTSPTNANYAVLNPINAGMSTTISQGNLTFQGVANTNQGYVLSTIGVESGSFYFEVQPSSFTGILEVYLSNNLNVTAGYRSDGTKDVDGVNSAYGASWTASDTIACAYNAGTKTVTFYKNNVSQGSFSYTGAGPVYAGVVVRGVGSANGYINFGQRPFSYTPPTGFNRLNTYNLPDSIVPVGAQYMAATTYTGNSSVRTITNTVNGTSFQPDFVWVKNRLGGNNHVLFDSVRGFGSAKDLSSNMTGAENAASDSLYGYVSGATTSGFSVAGGTGTPNNYDLVNVTAATYVGWQWRASNASAVTNTAGTITSQVSANQTAGFSIVTYTGTGANATVGHGLGVAPRMFIIKSRSLAGENWWVWHTSLPTPTTSRILLNLTNAYDPGAASYWNSTLPSSTVLSIGTTSGNNGSGATYVAYCFAAVPGYSAFGSYTGNGSADGPFVYTGFRPRWILLKDLTNANNWQMLDSSRNTYNVANSILQPNLSDAESVFGVGGIDFLSNGFKIRTSSTGINTTSAVVIYAAFAENPFKNALAR